MYRISELKVKRDPLMRLEVRTVLEKHHETNSTGWSEIKYVVTSVEGRQLSEIEELCFITKHKNM